MTSNRRPHRTILKHVQRSRMVPRDNLLFVRVRSMKCYLLWFSPVYSESISVGGWRTFHVSTFICKKFTSLISVNESEWEMTHDSVVGVNVILSEIWCCCYNEFCNSRRLACGKLSHAYNEFIVVLVFNTKKYWFLIGLYRNFFRSPGGLRWWLRNENRQFFSAYIDIFLPIYNTSGIPGLQIPQSRIAGLRRDPGLQSLVG